MTTKLVNLKDGNDILIPKAIAGIDVNNLIASGQGGRQNLTYQATQDCVYVGLPSRDSRISINGTALYLNYFNEINTGSYIFYLKANDIIVIYGYDYGQYKVFGLKY